MNNNIISKTCENIAACTHLTTPAFVIDESILAAALQRVNDIKKAANCKVIYSVKALASPSVLQQMTGMIDGFSTSSLYEAKLARSIAPHPAIIHIVTPGFKATEIPEIAAHCNYVTLNSLQQYRQYRHLLSPQCHIGLRINPEISFIQDDRYNPCRAGSKLGMPLKQLESLIKNKEDLSAITGLHFHTNCESASLMPLLQTVEHLVDRLGDFLHQIQWINLGGGYLFELADIAPFYQAVALLREKYALDILIEPGRTLVQRAGFLAATVIDILENDKTIAILDTSINHMAEVYEYQFNPAVHTTAQGHHSYILAGASCLAGDVFGEYPFAKPLQLGSRIIFTDMGAYTQVKTNMFNGINRPSLYHHDANGKLILKKHYTYDDFLSHCGN